MRIGEEDIDTESKKGFNVVYYMRYVSERHHFFQRKPKPATVQEHTHLRHKSYRTQNQMTTIRMRKALKQEMKAGRQEYIQIYHSMHESIPRGITERDEHHGPTSINSESRQQNVADED